VADDVLVAGLDLDLLALAQRRTRQRRRQQHDAPPCVCTAHDRDSSVAGKDDGSIVGFAGACGKRLWASIPMLPRREDGILPYPITGNPRGATPPASGTADTRVGARGVILRLRR